jgi:hypothetical protein
MKEEVEIVSGLPRIRQVNARRPDPSHRNSAPNRPFIPVVHVRIKFLVRARIFAIVVRTAVSAHIEQPFSNQTHKPPFSTHVRHTATISSRG